MPKLISNQLNLLFATSDDNGFKNTYTGDFLNAFSQATLPKVSKHPKTWIKTKKVGIEVVKWAWVSEWIFSVRSQFYFRHNYGNKYDRYTGFMNPLKSKK